MNHSTRLLTPAEYLYRVLVPIQRRHAGYQSYQQTAQPRRQDGPYRGQPDGEQWQPAVRRLNLDPTSGQLLPRRPPVKEKQPRLQAAIAEKLSIYVLNGDIKTRWVQVRKDDGTLNSPQLLETLMADINHSSTVIRRLSAEGPTPDTAIVQIDEISDLLRKAANKAQAITHLERERKSSKPKQLELNWAISGNDLEMKLKQLEQFLDKGRKVEVLLAAKKRQRKANLEEGNGVLKALRERIEEVGAKEIKMEGSVLGQATLTIQKIKGS